MQIILGIKSAGPFGTYVLPKSG
ncbi:uncharacterized protein METZ01_LOCUS337564 [marine metagenome]|uniref:Uncharacterized protein n=1 Tax=marine metagenome TaxID=408172 RepID=A0A382QIF0_9ZZZZ